jgi:myo-inositol-1(or 4)-monophosphatase
MLYAARQAAGLLRECSPGRVSFKPDASAVTAADRASQDLIVSRLKSEFPGIAVIAEEQSAKENRRAGSSDYYFVIDPLDGTQPFVDGIPFFCVSIALCSGRRTLAGVIVDPNRGEEFTAAAGSRAFLNGSKISVTKRSRVQDMRINVNHNRLDRPLFDNVNGIIREIDVFHKLGSLCLEMAYVAAGRLDATINNYVSMWDAAAAGLVVEEAGGRWTLFDGSKPDLPVFEKFHVCASNGAAHNDLLGRILGK